MTINQLKVENFRNIKNAELDFSPTVNIFCGDNAQGKTNLLEAISIALGRSFRNIKKNDVVPFELLNENEKESEILSTSPKINLFYQSEINPEKINNISYLPTLVKINEIPLKKATNLYGEFKYVVFIPDNLNLIKGYPDARRYYIDNIAIMQNKSHRKYLAEYKEALKQRCAAYMSTYYSASSGGSAGGSLGGSNLGNMMDVWDDILIKQGINLTYGRLKYLNLIKKYAGEIYSKLSGGENGEVGQIGEVGENGQIGEVGEVLEIDYQSDVFGNINEINPSDKVQLYQIYKNRLNEVVNEGQSGKIPGAHRDDISFRINSRNAKSYGSQGQLRSIAVSLKLAEAEIIRSFNRENPVILLDEVLGELDGSRRKQIISHFVDSQVFITSCNINDFSNLPNIKVWKVENGTFTACSELYSSGE